MEGDPLFAPDRPIEPPLCERCGQPMRLMRTMTDVDGHERKDYECSTCPTAEAIETDIAPPEPLQVPD
jgi:hypothetical protein